MANITASNRPRSLAIQAEITAVQAEFTAVQAEVTGRVHQNRPRSLRPRFRKAEITVKRFIIVLAMVLPLLFQYHALVDDTTSFDIIKPEFGVQPFKNRVSQLF